MSEDSESSQNIQTETHETSKEEEIPGSSGMRKLLFTIARSNFAQSFIGFSFEHLSNVLPLTKVLANESVIGFIHPVKYWETHFLIVPKKAIKSLKDADLQNPTIQEGFYAIISGAQIIADLNHLNDYTLLLNGGTYQDVPQLHFHLAVGRSKDGTNTLTDPEYTSEIGEIIEQYDTIHVYQNAKPKRIVDILLVPQNVMATTFEEFDMSNDANKKALLEVLNITQQLVDGMHLQGYTLLVNTHDVKKLGRIVFHLLSGSRN